MARKYKIGPGTMVRFKEPIQGCPKGKFAAWDIVTLPIGTEGMVIESFRDYGGTMSNFETTLDIGILGLGEYRVRTKAPSRSLRVIPTPPGLELPFSWLSVTQGRYRLRASVMARRGPVTYILPEGALINVNQVDREGSKVTLGFEVLDYVNLSLDERHPDPMTFTHPEDVFEVAEGF